MDRLCKEAEAEVKEGGVQYETSSVLSSREEANAPIRQAARPSSLSRHALSPRAFLMTLNTLIPDELKQALTTGCIPTTLAAVQRNMQTITRPPFYAGALDHSFWKSLTDDQGRGIN